MSDYEKRLEDVDEQLRTVPPEGHPEPVRQETLQEFAGKTIERTEVIRQDPEVFGDVLYIHFTDGTTLRLEAGIDDLYGLLRWKIT
jgi:hypothetical protein